MLKLVSTQNEEFKAIYNKANLYLSKGLLELAEGMYQKLLARIAQGERISLNIKADIYHNLGMIAENNLQTEVAIKYYREALTCNKQRNMTWLFLARLYFNRFEETGSKLDHQAGFAALKHASQAGINYPVIELLKTKYAQI